MWSFFTNESGCEFKITVDWGIIFLSGLAVSSFERALLINLVSKIKANGKKISPKNIIPATKTKNPINIIKKTKIMSMIFLQKSSIDSDIVLPNNPPNYNVAIVTNVINLCSVTKEYCWKPYQENKFWNVAEVNMIITNPRRTRTVEILW